MELVEGELGRSQQWSKSMSSVRQQAEEMILGKQLKLEDVAAIMKALETTQVGLSSTEAENRLIQFGFNELPDLSFRCRRYRHRLHHRDDPIESLLRKHIVPQQWTLRDGQKVQICSYDLVPGDVVLLSRGDRVPGDVILLPDTDGGGGSFSTKCLHWIGQSC